jgi:hypothetical protein
MLLRDGEACLHWVLVGLALCVAGTSCKADKPGASPWSGSADTLVCVASPEPSDGVGPALGLVIRADVPVDTAGHYFVYGELYQDWGRGTVSYSNARGMDMSYPLEGLPTSPRSYQEHGPMQPAGSVPVYAERAGSVPVELWFPGSELRVRGRKGEAWVVIEVWDTASVDPRLTTATQVLRRRYHLSRIARLDPRAFVEQLPGEGRVPPMPRRDQFER